MSSVAVAPIAFEPFPLADGDGELPAELGRLEVPEDRRDPEGRKIRLAFVRVPARTSRPGPPIVYLAGGPGISGVDRARTRTPVFRALSEIADVISLDQRGIGLSSPNLDNPGRWDLPLDEPLTRESYLARARLRSRESFDYWTARNVALHSYVTTENSDDVEDLRRALGVGRVMLYGGSYGSHLGLSILRRHPDSVARALLFTIEGPDHTLKLPSQIDALLARLDVRLEAERPADARRPPVRAALGELIQRLDRAPVSASTADGTIVLGAFDLIKIVADGAGDAAFLQALPKELGKLLGGNHGWLARRAKALRTRAFGNAMAFVADCASGGTGARRRRLALETPTALLGDAIDLPFPHVEAEWGQPDLGDAFRAPFACDTPTLLMSGTLDGRTPPENGAEVVSWFRHGHHLVVDGASHDTTSAFTRHAVLAKPMLDFLRHGAFGPERLEIPFRFD